MYCCCVLCSPLIVCVCLAVSCLFVCVCCDSGRLTAADGLDSAQWEEAWSGSDDGDELDQLEVRSLHAAHALLLFVQHVPRQFVRKSNSAIILAVELY